MEANEFIKTLFRYGPTGAKLVIDPAQAIGLRERGLSDEEYVTPHGTLQIEFDRDAVVEVMDIAPLLDKLRADGYPV